MKVLFVASGNKKEGISPIIKTQAESLFNNGVQVEFFTINGKGLLSYLRHTYILKKILRRSKFDLIHAHYGLCGIISFFASRKEKIVVSFMGDDILGTNLSDGGKTIRSRILIKLNILLSKKIYDYSIVKSKQMLGAFGDIENVCVCPNGVDLSEFFPVEKSEAEQKLNLNSLKSNIIFVSDPSRPEKNFSLAQKAIEQLSAITILTPVYNVPQSLLKFYYSAACMLLMTSFHEGSPNVIKEALACNCPIVSTDVGDVKELFGETGGCYISTFESDDVAEKVRLALSFSGNIGRTSGRDRIIKLGLDSESVAQQIIGVYKKVLVNKV